MMICAYVHCRKRFKPGKRWSKYCPDAPCGNSERVRKYRLKKKRAAAKRAS